MAYQVGETVIYGVEGPCRIEAIGDPGISPRTKGKKFYSLRPLYKKGSMHYLPVEQEADKLRPVLTKEQAIACIEGFTDTEEVWVSNEKRREQEYHDVLYRSGCLDCTDLVRITKTIYQRKQDRITNGKRLTEVDQRYFRVAQEKLLQELSVALELTPEETDRFIQEKLRSEAS